MMFIAFVWVRLSGVTGTLAFLLRIFLRVCLKKKRRKNRIFILNKISLYFYFDGWTNEMLFVSLLIWWQLLFLVILLFCVATRFFFYCFAIVFILKYVRFVNLILFVCCCFDPIRFNLALRVIDEYFKRILKDYKRIVIITV